jgi:hypothetical protein
MWPCTGSPARARSVGSPAASTTFPSSIPISGHSPHRWRPWPRAIAGRDRVRLQLAGAYAANALGLTEQVPAKVVFLTDGISRTVTIGGTTIHLRRATPRNMEPAGRLSGLLIQAFRELGKEHVTPERIAHLKRTLPAGERRKLLDDLRLAPTWMHTVFRDLAARP